MALVDANEQRQGWQGWPATNRQGTGCRWGRLHCLVANLSYKLDENGLAEAFAHCGEVLGAELGLDRETGRPRGIGWVSFTNPQAAERALEMNGQDVSGREIRVDTHAGPQGGGPPGQRKPPKNQLMGGSVSDCWFCLSNSDADLHLVASIREHAYIALDKGPIVPDHVLLIPIDHQPSTADITPEAYNEIQKYIVAYRKYAQQSGEHLVMFERFMAGRKEGGNHCHTNMIPIPKARAVEAEMAFLSGASEHGFDFETRLGPADAPQGQQELKAAVGSGPFLCVTLPDGNRLVHAIVSGERHPMSFGREVAADLLGQSSRADWNECKLPSQEAEEGAVNAFKKRFEAFDPGMC